MFGRLKLTGRVISKRTSSGSTGGLVLGPFLSASSSTSYTLVIENDKGTRNAYNTKAQIFDNVDEGDTVTITYKVYPKYFMITNLERINNPS